MTITRDFFVSILGKIKYISNSKIVDFSNLRFIRAEIVGSAGKFSHFYTFTWNMCIRIREEYISIRRSHLFTRKAFIILLTRVCNFSQCVHTQVLSRFLLFTDLQCTFFAAFTWKFLSLLIDDMHYQYIHHQFIFNTPVSAFRQRQIRFRDTFTPQHWQQ